MRKSLVFTRPMHHQRLMGIHNGTGIRKRAYNHEIILVWCNFFFQRQKTENKNPKVRWKLIFHTKVILIEGLHQWAKSSQGTARRAGENRAITHAVGLSSLRNKVEITLIFGRRPRKETFFHTRTHAWIEPKDEIRALSKCMLYLCRRARVHDLESSNLESAPFCLHHAPSTSRRVQSGVWTCPNHLPHSTPCQAWRGLMLGKQHLQGIFCKPLNPLPYCWIAWENAFHWPLPFSFLLCALRATLVVSRPVQEGSRLLWYAGLRYGMHACMQTDRLFWPLFFWSPNPQQTVQFCTGRIHTRLKCGSQLTLPEECYGALAPPNANQSHRYRGERLNPTSTEPVN